ncbi:MAG TPA: MBL fold metallo-hydrolase [Thermoanaerobaculia bacterium]
MYSRRDFAQRVFAAIAATALDRRAFAATRSRLVLLGTGGGPRPRPDSYASSQVIVAGGAAYVIDCGDGVATQLVKAGISLTALRAVFITHHHSDHNADYGNLLLLAWESGLRRGVRTFGPPPLRRITRLFIEMNAVDIRARVEDEGRVPFEPLIEAHELSRSGAVMTDSNVSVTCARVEHPPLDVALAYRFDCSDRSIVISGDTKPSNALVKLAHQADILVHEALYVPAVERLAARVPDAAKLRKSILNHHTSVEDAGRIAAAAGVKTLVLSHLVPPDDPAITPEMWLEAAKKHFDGQVIVGRDLLEL